MKTLIELPDRLNRQLARAENEALDALRVGRPTGRQARSKFACQLDRRTNFPNGISSHFAVLRIFFEIVVSCSLPSSSSR